MSGHSKWSQIKRQKGAADEKRGVLYTRLGHMIALAVREGGKDPSMNFKLRLILEKARAGNMPGTTIERAIKRGAGELEGEARIEPVVYEGYGPGGIALLVEAATNNKNRMAAKIRHILGKYGGNVGSSGSVQWLFEPRGKIVLRFSNVTDKQELAIIDAGAQDITEDKEGTVVLTRQDELEAVRQRLESGGLPVISAELVLIPKNRGSFSSEQEQESFLRLLDELEALDEVAHITSNAPI